MRSLKLSILFMNRSERRNFYFLLAVRCLLPILDLTGVLGIGFLATSIAHSLITGSNTVSGFIEFGKLRLQYATIQTFPVYTLLILFVFALKSLVGAILTFRMARKIAEIETRATSSAITKALNPSYYLSTNANQEKIAFAIQTGGPAAFSGLLNNFATIVSEGFLFLGLTVGFLLLDPLATLELVAYLVILGVIINLLVGKRMSKVANKQTRFSIDASQKLYDIFSAYKTLSVAGKLRTKIHQVVNGRQVVANNVAKQVTLSGMPRYIIETGLIFGVFLLSIYLANTNDLLKSAATLGAFLTGGLRIVAAMLPWQMAFVNLKVQVPQSEAFHELLDLTPERTGDSQMNIEAIHQRLRPTPPVIQMRGVSFNFVGSKNSIIRDLNLHVGAKSHVAIMGPSGAGKSTVADLLLGLLTPTEGEILIDDLTPNEYLSKNPGAIAYLPQFPGMVNGTIRENITLEDTNTEIDESRLQVATKLAHLDTLISELPLGLETNLGGQRDALSGGQIQRIGLARALYQNPVVLVIDEGTSALDSESEDVIAENISSLKGKLTIVQITHKLETVSNADAVLHLINGTISASNSAINIHKTSN